MKKPDYSKIIKVVCIIAVVAVVILYFENNSKKANQEKDRILSGIASIAEDLHELSKYAEDSMDYDYEDMGVSLYHLQEECEKLSKQAEELCNSKLFKDYEPEENKNSWFY